MSKNLLNEIESLVSQQHAYSKETISLIASENFHPLDSPINKIMGAPSLADKYAEGYPERRYYAGCKWIDMIESWSIAQACDVYQVRYANLQLHSGSQANQAVYLALLDPNDLIMSLSLKNGGHLTHGHRMTVSGSLYRVINYPLNAEGTNIDYDQLEQDALTHRPKIIVAGFSAFSYVIDWARISKIAQQVNAYFLADIAHISGLVASGCYPNPAPYADVITTTTHKTLGGPRGAMIMTNNPELSVKLNKSVFPGIQGGPHMGSIAAKGWALAYAKTAEFKQEMRTIINNAQLLGRTLQDKGIRLCWSDINTHIVLVDLRPCGQNGLEVEESLERAHILCNRNQIPYDDASPFKPSGVRFGSVALTRRKCQPSQIEDVASWIAQIVQHVGQSNQAKIESEVKEQVIAMCKTIL